MVSHSLCQLGVITGRRLPQRLDRPDGCGAQIVGRLVHGDRIELKKRAAAMDDVAGREHRGGHDRMNARGDGRAASESPASPAARIRTGGDDPLSLRAAPARRSQRDRHRRADDLAWGHRDSQLRRVAREHVAVFVWVKQKSEVGGGMKAVLDIAGDANPAADLTRAKKSERHRRRRSTPVQPSGRARQA